MDLFFSFFIYLTFYFFIILVCFFYVARILNISVFIFMKMMIMKAVTLLRRPRINTIKISIWTCVCATPSGFAWDVTRTKVVLSRLPVTCRGLLLDVVLIFMSYCVFIQRRFFLTFSLPLSLVFNILSFSFL